MVTVNRVNPPRGIIYLNKIMQFISPLFVLYVIHCLRKLCHLSRLILCNEILIPVGIYLAILQIIYYLAGLNYVRKRY